MSEVDHTAEIERLRGEITRLREEVARARVGWEICAKWAQNLGAIEPWYQAQISEIRASHARTKELGQ